MLVCTGKLEIRVLYYSVHLLHIACFPAFQKYSPSNSTIFRLELVNPTWRETIGIFQPTPKYQLAPSLLLCLKQSHRRSYDLKETFRENYQSGPRTRIRVKKGHDPNRK